MSANAPPKAPVKAPMTKSDAARIQSAAAKSNGGQVPKGSFASRASSASARNGK